MTSDRTTATETEVKTPQAPPTPHEVDMLVREYAAAAAAVAFAMGMLKIANEAQSEIKIRLVDQVEAFGQRHTEKSKRLTGIHSTATTTTGTRLSTDSAAVETFKEYLQKSEVPNLFGRFFSAHTTYSLVDGPGDVAKTLDLGSRMRTKIAQLTALCFRVTTNAPSLKVETVASAKPEKS
jgi:hypothetical protein